MNTQQLVVRSAVTIVATGLTLLSSSTSQANGRGPSSMRMSGIRGGMNNGAIHQGISNRSLAGARGVNNAIGQNSIENRGPNRGNHAAMATQMRSRDDRGGQGERRHGKDDGIGHDASVTRGEREHERRHGKDDGIGHDSSVTRGEREREHRHGKDDGIGHDSSVTRGERERERRHGKDDGIGHDIGDDHGQHHEPGDR